MIYKRGIVPVESQDFAENKDEHHTDEDAGLLHVCADTLDGLLARSSFSRSLWFTYRVTDDSNRVACRKSSQAHTKATGQMHEAVEQAVVLLRWRLHVAGNKYCHY